MPRHYAVTTTMYAHLATPARRQKLAELLEEGQ